MKAAFRPRSRRRRSRRLSTDPYRRRRPRCKRLSRQGLPTAGCRMNVRSAPSLIAAATVVIVLGADAPVAQPVTHESSTVLSSEALTEIAQIEAEIDRIEAQSIERLMEPPDNQVQQIELLGQLLLYAQPLSVNHN